MTAPRAVPGIDLEWSVRKYRAELVRDVAAARQAEALATYGLTALGHPMNLPQYAHVTEATHRDEAYALERTLAHFDSWLELAGLDLREEA